jgi:hypothetical protein
VVGVIWFVTPAFQRFELTRVCLEQRRRAIDFLAERGVAAQCVVVADDQNADTAKELGFAVVRRRNYALGKRFNDGIEYAARNGAEWIVPIGSDSFIDPAYLFPLPADHVMRSSTLYAIAEPERLGRLRIRSAHGVGPYMIPRSHLPPSMRPAANYLNRGIDGSTLRGLTHGWTVEKVDLHPWQYIGFRRETGRSEAHPQMNSYNKLYGRLGVGEEYEVAERLSEYYPPELVERAIAACRVSVEVAA